MAYVALYRKYRSQNFGELMGQEHVTTTLQNALRSGRIAHAYLFHGARGCGKTSTARLLARALNCIAQDGPTPEPCGQCRLCVSIRDGACMDVIEMDAASETGIDDVREKIIENVQYAPGEARYKVYIIDEVHDLSAKAFDALLKTLEEPPGHVVFILATTEHHKVPVTIRSRCANFSFKRGTLQDLSAAVQRVLELEGYTGEPEAVQSIARAAEGSWRDALSLLEQVLAYSDTHVTSAAVHRALGTVGMETLARVTEVLAQGDWAETLAVAGELVDSGKDVRQLLTALSGHLRELMLIAAGARQAAAQELGPDRLAFLAPQAAQFTPPTLLAMMGALAEAEKETRFSNQHRWILERTLARLMLLQQSAEAGALPASPASIPANGRAAAPRREGTAPPPLAATPTPVPKPPLPAATHVHLTAPIDEEPDEVIEEAIVEEEAPLPLPSVSATSAAMPSPHANGASVAEEAPPAAREERNGAPTPIAAVPVTAAPTEDRFAADVTLEVVRRAWSRVLKLFEKVSPSGKPWLEKGEVVGLEGNTVILAFRESFARDRIQNNIKGRASVEKTLNQALNTEGYKIRCIMEEVLADGNANGLTPANGASANMAVARQPEMPTLLEAPPVAPTAPARIADFEVPVGPVAPTPHNGANGVDPTPPTDAKPLESEAPASTGLLAETLDIFGGEVIATEPL